MKKRVIAVLISAILLYQPLSVSAAAAPDGMTDASKTPAAQNGAWDAWCEEWETIKTDWTQVAMSPGSDETEMNFAWYTKEGEEASFVYGQTPDLSDGQSAAVSESPAQTGYKSSKVVIKDLKPGTTYYYQVGGKEICSFTTDADTSSFSFIFVGDPQIGSSNPEKAKTPEDILKPSFAAAQSEAVRNDTFNWNDTLTKAYEKTNRLASFVLSSGDQIQTNAKKVQDTTISEVEYAGYLSPDLMKSVPVATTVGNHDADNANYTYHFNPANSSSLGDNGTVGGDYYYTYGDALFMILNTQDTNVEEHRQFIESTVAANTDCKWKIVTLHQDIYGSAEHSNEPEITNLRYSLVPVFEQNEIDLVLAGHDHAYSRTKMLEGGQFKMEYSDDEFEEQLEKDMDAGENPDTLYEAPGNISEDTQDEGEQKYLKYLHAVMDEEAVMELTENQETAVNSDGIMYLTAGSSSGSKYYDLVPRQQTYIANRWQQDVPTYSVVDITETTLTVNTYRTDTQEPIDTQFMLVKSVDHGQLSALIEEAGSKNPEEYTTESYQTMQQALEGARTVNADPAADTATLTNAYTALKTALDQLEMKHQENLNPPSSSDSPDNGQSQNGGTSGSMSDQTTHTEGINKKPVTSKTTVKTGDAVPIAGVVIVMLTALLCGGGVLVARRKRDQK